MLKQPITLPDGRKVERPHREWSLHQLRWRWLLDSWEGGEGYRTASYGTDSRGYPVRNLIRHKREYPGPPGRANGTAGDLLRAAGSDQYASALEDDDYQLRLARTPVPLLLSEVIDRHLSKVYSQEIDREAKAPSIAAWWKDVNGRGTPIDAWMQQTIAPLFLALGQLDLIFDHPPATGPVVTLADQQAQKLDRCVAGYILPVNLLWWRIDRRGRYTECLVREVDDDDACRYRYWSPVGWWLYDEDGNGVSDAPHPYGRVPIVRVFDRLRPSCTHTGLPRYEQVAELQREFYNRDSELILSDTSQAHPLLQGPEDYVQPDGTVPIGPNWLLPKKKSVGTSTTYEGFDVVEFPKEGAKSIQENLDRIRERVDRAALLTKPAGGVGSSAAVVGQSGISKQMDDDLGNRLLSQISSVLEGVELVAIEFVSVVLASGEPPEGAAAIGYPREFDLSAAGEQLANIVEFQSAVSASGALPETEEELLCAAVRKLLPGRVDDDYEVFDREIKKYLASKAAQHEQREEANLMIVQNEAKNAGPPDPASDPAAR